ncbi:MAG TPA: flavin reductase family protein [Roseiflexaceae bacterium]|nr:flavin reductase family protein [Roseiflexaceae bacterium]
MDEKAKSDLLHKLTYGLYVLTSEGGGERGGMLVTWVIQASFEPPMVAVAVQNTAHTTEVIKKSGAFALNFMADEQRKEAAAFGKKYAKVGDKFADFPYHAGGATGSPILDDALGYLECRVKGWLPGGDHDIALAEIVDAKLSRDAALMTTVSSGMSYAG